MTRVVDEPTHIPVTVAVYTFETEEITYKARRVYRKNCVSCGTEGPLDVTLHGTTKVAVEGMKMRVLDDDGKEVKLGIIENAAKSPAT
jgi:hypothetical protein